MRVYIAGPYEKPDQAINTRIALDTAEVLRSKGLYPFVPHLMHFWHFVYPRDDWLEYDLVWLKECNCLLRLPGESEGADVEVAEAKRYDIPVFYSIEDVLAYYGRRGL